MPMTDAEKAVAAESRKKQLRAKAKADLRRARVCLNRNDRILADSVHEANRTETAVDGMDGVVETGVLQDTAPVDKLISELVSQITSDEALMSDTEEAEETEETEETPEPTEPRAGKRKEGVNTQHTDKLPVKYWYAAYLKNKKGVLYWYFTTDLYEFQSKTSKSSIILVLETSGVLLPYAKARVTDLFFRAGRVQWARHLRQV